MWLRRFSTEPSGVDEALSATVEPLAGHSDEEIKSALECPGAVSVEILSPGVIAYRGSRAPLEAIETIANISVDPVHQFYHAF